MAKVWAKAFYDSRIWKDCRRAVLRRDLFTCRDCNARASEVHHIIELTPDNISDPMIALNPDNLVSLCHACHDKITKGLTGDLPPEYLFNDKGEVVRR